MSNGIQRKLDIVEKKIGQASKNDLAELGQNVSVNQTVGASPNLTFQKYKENVEKILLRSTLKNRQKKITQQNSKIMKLNAEVEQLIEQNEKKSLDIEVKETELKIQKRNIENLESNLFALKTAKDEIVNELETKKTAYKENSKFIENLEGQIRSLQQQNGQYKIELSGQEKAKAWQIDHFKKCEKEKAEYESKNEEISAKLSEIIDLVHKKQLDIKEIEETISEEKLKFDGQKEYLEQQQVVLEEQKSLLESTIDKKKNLIEKNIDTESKIKEVEETISLTQDEISNTESKVLGLQEQYNEVIAEENELKTNLVYLQDQFNAIAEEKNRVSTELNSAEQNLFQLKKDFDKLTFTSKEIDEELAVLSKKREDVRQRNSEIQKSIENQELINRDIREAIASCKSELHLLREAVSQKDLALSDLKTIFQREKQMHNEFLNSIEKQQRLLTDKNNELGEITIQKNEQSSKIMALEKENKFFSLEIEKTQTKLSDAEKNYFHVCERSKEVTKEVESKKAEYNSIVAKIKGIEEDVQSENQKLSFLKKENQKNYEKLEEKESALRHFKNELAEAITFTCSEDDKKQEIQNRIKVVSENIVTLKGEIQTQISASQKISVEVASKNEKLEELIDQMQIIEAKNKDLQSHVEEKSFLLDEKTKILSERSKTFSELKRKNERLEEKVSVLACKIKEKSEKIKFLDENVSSYQVAYEKIKSEYLEMTRVYESTHAQSTKLSKEVTEVRALIAEQNQKNRKKKSEISLLRGKLNSLNKIHADAQRFSQEQQSQNKELEQNISSLTKELSEVPIVKRNKVNASEVMNPNEIEVLFENITQALKKNFEGEFLFDFHLSSIKMKEEVIKSSRQIAQSLLGLKYLNVKSKKLRLWERENGLFISLVLEKNNANKEYIDFEFELNKYVKRFNQFSILSLKEFDDKVSVNLKISKSSSSSVIRNLSNAVNL